MYQDNWKVIIQKCHPTVKIGNAYFIYHSRQFDVCCQHVGLSISYYQYAKLYQTEYEGFLSFFLFYLKSLWTVTVQQDTSMYCIRQKIKEISKYCLKSFGMLFIFLRSIKEATPKVVGITQIFMHISLGI